MSYKGYKASEETRLKMRQAKLGRKLSENTKLKMSLAHKGKKLSDEAKLNIRQGIFEKRNTANYAQKLSDAKKGEVNPQSVLTEEDVKKIRSLYKPYKMSQNKLAQMFNVHRSTIQDIIERRTWKHIE